MFRCSRSRVAVAALMLVVFLLSGCLGQKTFTVTVEITPALAGVNIHENSETGTLKAITDEAGMAEIKNVKAGTILVPVKEGYSFKPKNAKVTKAGTIEFAAQETDPGDPVQKAHELVERVEEAQPPERYGDLVVIRELITDAREAVQKLDDPMLRYELKERIDKKEEATEETLSSYVSAVQEAVEQDKGQLLASLKAFWAAEDGLLETYWRMVQPENQERLEVDLIDVDAIRQTVIERAPQLERELEISDALFMAAGAGLDYFRDELIKYRSHFQRVNLEHDRKDLVIDRYQLYVREMPPLTIEQVQLSIDVANIFCAFAATAEAASTMDREDWQWAVEVAEYLIEEMKEPFQTILNIMDLLLKVFEAKTPDELLVALQAIETEYLHGELGEDYCEAIGKLDAPPFQTDYEIPQEANDLIETLNDLIDIIAETLDKTRAAIQGAVDKVNEENVRAVLSRIGEEIDEKSHDDLVLGLLQMLDRATPIAVQKGEDRVEVDFDLEDQELEFDPALVNLYKRELAGFTLGDQFTSEAVADVRHRLKGVYNQFESLTVEVKEAMVRSQGGIELVVKAFDKKGRPFLGFDGKELDDAQVFFHLPEGDWAEAEATPVGQVKNGTAEFVVKADHNPIYTITEVSAALIAFTADGVRLDVRSGPFTVDAEPTHYSVDVCQKPDDDGKIGFKAGERVPILIELFYEYTDSEGNREYDWAGNFSGRLSATLKIGKDDVFNPDLEFALGMSGLDQEVIIASEEAQEVELYFLDKDLELCDSFPEIHVVPDDADHLAVKWAKDQPGYVQLTVEDRFGNTVTSMNGLKRISFLPDLAVRGEDQLMAALAIRPDTSPPDRKGDAWVTFTAGKGTVQLVDSPFDKALEPRKYELYILLEDWENDVYVSGVLDYEKK